MKPFSIIQAFNFLKEKKDNLLAGKKEKEFGLKLEGDKDQAISTALPQDRVRYLTYCVSFLKDERLKTLLTLRINGATPLDIAKHYKVHPDLVLKLEREALSRAKDAMTRVKNNPMNVPIIGGIQ